jgi:DNA-binding NarL/FixJ family response regulator
VAVLTPRQMTIAPLLARGMSFKQMAHELRVSSQYLRVTASQMYKRTGTDSRWAFAIWWLTSGLEDHLLFAGNEQDLVTSPFE